VILHQGWGILLGAWGQLTDKGVSVQTRDALIRALDPLLLHTAEAESGVNGGEIRQPRRLRAIRDLRARRAGSLMFVDLTADVDGTLSVSESSELEQEIDSTLRQARTEIAEVQVRFRDIAENEKHL
jgi:divalent metal cation (Fe/Co/Zn/Cd) transporter